MPERVLHDGRVHKVLDEDAVRAVCRRLAKQGVESVAISLLFSFFFFIWVLNFMSIVPFLQFPVTSRFAIPLAFAVLVYLFWVPLGVKRQGAGPFFKAMTMPGLMTALGFSLPPTMRVRPPRSCRRCGSTTRIAPSAPRSRRSARPWPPAPTCTKRSN